MEEKSHLRILVSKNPGYHQRCQLTTLNLRSRGVSCAFMNYFQVRKEVSLSPSTMQWKWSDHRNIRNKGPENYFDILLSCFIRSLDSLGTVCLICTYQVYTLLGLRSQPPLDPSWLVYALGLFGLCETIPADSTPRWCHFCVNALFLWGILINYLLLSMWCERYCSIISWTDKGSCFVSDDNGS